MNIHQIWNMMVKSFVKWALGCVKPEEFENIVCMYLNIWVAMNNDLFVHSWGDLPIIFTRDCITRDNYRRIIPRVSKNSLFMATHTSFYLLYAFLALKYREIDVKSHRWVTAQCCLWWFSWMRYCDITKTSIVTSFWLIALRTFLSRRCF